MGCYKTFPNVTAEIVGSITIVLVVFHILSMNEPFWFRSLLEGKLILQRYSYQRTFRWITGDSATVVLLLLLPLSLSPLPNAIPPPSPRRHHRAQPGILPAPQLPPLQNPNPQAQAQAPVRPPPVEPQAAALGPHPARGRHHVGQGRRGQDDHDGQHRALAGPPGLLGGGHRRRRGPPQPGPPAGPGEPRELHGPGGPQRRLPAGPGPGPRQALVQLRAALHLEAPVQAPPGLRREGPHLGGGRAQGAHGGLPGLRPRGLPAGIDAGFITAIAPANEAVLVTTPDITSLRDADRVTGLLECDGIRDIKMIVNRVRTDMIKGDDMMSVLDVQEMLGLPLLGVIPEDSEVIRSTNRGYPLVLNKPPTLAGLAFEQAAWRLVEQDSMQAVVVEEQPKRGFFSFFGG
ncbi:putative septum site-determining protein minD-like [Spatholobus suberectus]|nr:putative septum site-determining protein minD-like [Spatholobus suberectus]